MLAYKCHVLTRGSHATLGTISPPDFNKLRNHPALNVLCLLFPSSSWSLLARVKSLQKTLCLCLNLDAAGRLFHKLHALAPEQDKMPILENAKVVYCQIGYVLREGHLSFPF